MHTHSARRVRVHTLAQSRSLLSRMLDVFRSLCTTYKERSGCRHGIKKQLPGH